jgi:hypothetical protein
VANIEVLWCPVKDVTYHLRHVTFVWIFLVGLQIDDGSKAGLASHPQQLIHRMTQIPTARATLCRIHPCQRTRGSSTNGKHAILSAFQGVEKHQVVEYNMFIRIATSKEYFSVQKIEYLGRMGCKHKGNIAALPHEYQRLRWVGILHV